MLQELIGSASKILRFSTEKLLTVATETNSQNNYTN